MFPTLGGSFLEVFGENERGKLQDKVRRYDVCEPPVHIESWIEHDTGSGVRTSLSFRSKNRVYLGISPKLSAGMLCILHGIANIFLTFIS